MSITESSAVSANRRRAWGGVLIADSRRPKRRARRPARQSTWRPAESMNRRLARSTVRSRVEDCVSASTRAAANSSALERSTSPLMATTAASGTWRSSTLNNPDGDLISSAIGRNYSAVMRIRRRVARRLRKQGGAAPAGSGGCPSVSVVDRQLEPNARLVAGALDAPAVGKPLDQRQSPPAGLLEAAVARRQVEAVAGVPNLSAQGPVLPQQAARHPIGGPHHSVHDDVRDELAKQ